ncbi:MAG: PKD domain-containing protein [Flavobacteriales bacterium]
MIVRITISIILSLLLLNARATHIVGGEINYECVGGNNYLITVKIYRDCSSPQNAPFDPSIPVGVFDGVTNTLLVAHSFSNPLISPVPVVINDPCYQPPGGICVQEAIYIQTITLQPNANGYILSHQRCCRNAGIVNIVNPGAVGATFLTYISPDALAVCNSGPEFSQLPPLVVCNGIPFSFDHSASDPNGDDLVYSFYHPFNGGTTGNPAPSPPATPPYFTVPFSAGYTVNQQITGAPNLTINNVTGELICLPNTNGLFVFGVVVEEYRNGVLFTRTYREFQTTVAPCPQTVVSSIPNQTDFCSGFTVNLANNSLNANDYLWNFGDPNNPNATSTDFAPSYTYSDTGSYTITLIANPGLSCADTATVIYSIQPPLNITFINPGPKCFHNQNMTFDVNGNFTNAAQIQWNFGPNANIPVSNNKTVNGVTFDYPGKYLVVVNVEEFGCSAQHSDSVEVIPLPVPLFLPVDTGCAPYTVQFENLSTSSVPATYIWNFGDGNFSTLTNPTHTYINPGTYTVTLTVLIDSVCSYNASYTIPNTVHVNVSPFAGIGANQLTADIYYPTITFFDQSQGATQQIIYFGDGEFSYQSPAVHDYLNSGYHYAHQWVINEFGCTDTAVVTIFISPDTRIYVPNTFTPNGDGINDVFLPIVNDVLDYELFIYNRWGNVIFKTTNTQEGWDGTLKGDKSPIDTYIYKIWYNDWQNMRYEIIGHVSLVR